MALAYSQYRREDENCKKGQVAWAARSCIRLAALLIAVIFNSSCEADVATKEDVVLFSQVKGRIALNGEPLANAKVIRRYKYDTAESIEDFCVTNNKGEFDLPLIVNKDLNTTPLVQFVVHQQIFVVRDGKEQQIWMHGKMKKNENSEYGGQFKNVYCELTKELERVKVGSVEYVFTNCVWESTKEKI